MQGQERSFSKEGRVKLEGEEYKEFLKLVFSRDGYQCRNPFCKTKSGLTPHHVKKRSHQGSDVPENVITLCVACHDMVERNELEIVPVDIVVKFFYHRENPGK